MRPTAAILLAAALVLRVRANADKVIFTAPAPVDLPPLAKPSLPSLSDLDVILPPHVHGDDGRSSLRTSLTRVFPPDQGQPAWFLLSNLTEGQRYELRLCWSALARGYFKEPTRFNIDVYSPHTVWQTPALSQSLAEHAAFRQASATAIRKPPPDAAASGHGKASVMLLRVQAIADYFSHHRDLMENPPPVLVDLILDPYIYNIVPQSIIPTAAYLVLVAIVAWFLARWTAGHLISIAASPSRKRKQG